MRRTVTILIVLAIIVGGGYAFYRYRAAQQRQQLLADLQTVEVGRGSLVATVGATGVVRAQQSATLVWQTTGIVGEIKVSVGERVREGQVLATLEQTSLPQNVILAQAELVSAQKALDELYDSHEGVALAQARRAVLAAEQEVEAAQERVDNLPSWADELDEELAKADLELAQAQWVQAQESYEKLLDGPTAQDIAAAEARIAAAQATLDLAFIEAPFTGTVTQVTLKSGDLVAPNLAAFRIDDLSRLLVEVQVSEVDVNRIAPGQDVTLSFDAILGKQYHGQVSEVSPVGTVQQGVVNFNVTVELTDADEAVKPGMTAAVNIVVSELDDVLLVPNRAVRVVDGQRVVYVFEGESSLEPVEITLGASSDTNSEVLEGDLQVGDQIVLNPPTEFDTNGPPPFVGGGQ